ncbi:MAG TPA: pyrroloquinoline quinone biosynthesis peptide chaperone PqqD [Alphaproteobacteria bacterium]|nr:pyrroloquinoline quinone biosynthesis protein D [Alphaproteobacteria bacterium]HEX4889837.1 pyrroloquinoline quinone biosynthesis peptide chaperone PqqD [Alphaproteobacteria bacterium]
MNAAGIEASGRPALARGVKMRFDEARQQWILNAPERVLVLDEIAHAVLSRCNGEISINELCRELALEFAAPQEIIQADVLEMMSEMLHKGYISL